MAGLLDFLSSDDARLGMGLLAAGGPSTVPMNVGQRVQMAMQGLDADKQNKLKQQLLQSQITENAAQSDMQRQKLAMAQRQMDMDAQFLGLGGAPAASPSAIPAMAAPTAGAVPIPEAAAGMPRAVEAFAQGTPATFGGVALTAQQIAQKYGIPIEAIINDYRSNGGKKIAEFIMTKGTPDMQVSNGYAYDKNALKPGFLPSLTTSQSGQTSMTQIRDGMPVVSAPPGALDTYGAYRRADAGLKPIKVYDPLQGREVYTNEAAVAGGRPAPAGAPAGYGTEAQMRTTAQGDMGADPQAIAREVKAIQNDLLTKKLDEPSRAALKAQLSELLRQGQNIGVPPTAYAAGPSAAETIANEAAKTKAVGTASADVARDTAGRAETKRGAQMGEVATIANQLLDAGPTGSGVGALADQVGNFIGRPLKGATQAQQLEALSGWLTANIPRMEGPQSDADVRNYATMAGKIGDRTLPAETRKAALATLIELQGKYAALNGVEAPKAAAPSGAKPPTPMKGMTMDGYKFKGGNPADPSNWTKL